MLSAHNGELISKNLFIDRADRINSSGGGRFIIIIITCSRSAAWRADHIARIVQKIYSPADCAEAI
jgi:hypothetical protein